MGLWPEVNLIRLLVNLGSIQTVAAWMDHFIVGVVVWGLMFGALDAMWESRAYWLKGLIFGVFAWLMMMILFMPLAKAGWFGTRIGPAAALVPLGIASYLWAGAGGGLRPADGLVSGQGAGKVVGDAERLSRRASDHKIGALPALPAARPALFAGVRPPITLPPCCSSEAARSLIKGRGGSRILHAQGHASSAPPRKPTSRSRSISTAPAHRRLRPASASSTTCSTSWRAIRAST